MQAYLLNHNKEETIFERYRVKEAFLDEFYPDSTPAEIEAIQEVGLTEKELVFEAVDKKVSYASVLDKVELIAD